MVNQPIGAFSIYRHVNQRQRHRHDNRFIVRDSPSPSPGPSQERNQFTQQIPTPMANVISNKAENSETRIYGEQPRCAPISDFAAAMTSTPKLTPSKPATASLRQPRGVPPSSKPSPASRFSTPSEADEAPPVEEVHSSSRIVGITNDALRIEGTPVKVEDEHSETSHSKTPPSHEVYGYEHRTFFMHTKRSLRGRTTAEVNYPGAKLHVAHSNRYYELCDTDILFNSDEERRNRHPLKPRHDCKGAKGSYAEAPSNQEGISTGRPRTRSTATASNNSDIAIPGTGSQSDVDNQRFFAQWTEQMVQKQFQLTEKINISDKQIDDLRAIISIRDEDIDKLQAKVRDLRRKKQNDAKVVALQAEVAALKEQVAVASIHAQEQKERLDSQNTQLKAVYRTKAEESDRLKKHIQDLERQNSVLISEASAPVAAHRPSSIPSPRPYISPLSRAIGRNMSAMPAPVSPFLPPQVDSGYLALVDAAKEVVRRGAGLLKGFGQVSEALIKLKEALEQCETRKEA